MGRHRQKVYGPYIPKIQFLDRCIFKFLLHGPWNSIEHKVNRNSIILTFTSFSITHAAGKTCFYVHELSSYARMRHRQKAYGPSIPKLQFSDRDKFKFLLQGPWNSIEHKVNRNGIILTFTSFSITHAAGKPAFYVRELSSYARMRHRQKAYGS
jgi:hypothetical protein